ncbi:uncharacterized protein OCT59_000512 [Rhizophagus irregularis]|uniref:F-box domain-containing protein n=2 Tax=Rhizophagus irregularis TaxID=588596 RepID=A0A015J184_RHIIW|nr:hypothetical protein GLOIN_2v1776889 [Rhizophagus irregularis DAOM 181602=DAOM 197198]EXX60475.1 hypothetical protein RirG_179550 [Rhizophagus irregularis DAOM 197198w]POG69559.1 hypothetical protein GLOIN_2v1776889 [Rhizophagus irregularis DAOM 181602=DAOM 197198]UZN99232.1 hypothetical protein OCT59_000512 [Rhizophagus irregularis]GBC48028.1 hypothetical protein GLOIN_2v1776889 [Rhizophagus irregularis DAOM 181602=DAOM 197198]|eukprot:XP_025176425.1 hypothetical protein GLOIN_2v1776889 [Rhizophagus irregularis DAOM 181602=DAOM 197198]
MACSKIFSGELPELLSEIIQYFRNDFSTLHSCILVNRLWCRLAIPLLWENPFSIIPNKNYFSIEYHKIRFIETYLVMLNDNDKIKLYEFGINNPLHSNILFNYSSFIQYLDTRLVGDCIENWVSSVKKNEKPSYIFLKITQNLDFIKFVYKSLIKMFIENEAVLHTFDIKIRQKYFDIVSELVLQSSNFICNIRNFYLESYLYENDNITPLLKFLNSNCNSISSLYISSSCNHKDNSKLIEYSSQLSQLIKSQKNLKKIFFLYDFPHSTLLNSNCLNTLNTIILFNIDFKNINFLNEIFEQLNVLESIHIIYCRSLDFNFIQQIINLTKPFKLKSLFVNKIFESIELLLQKSGDYLENFGFGSFKIYDDDDDDDDESESQLIELITKYCKKIRFFELYEFNIQNIYPSFNLIKNIQQNLNYLTIDLNYDFGMCFCDSDAEVSSIVLRNLGQILPPKLEYLNMSLVMNTNDFIIFLQNSQNTFIKKLIFSNIINGTREKVGQDDMLYYIKEYIMKKRRVKYFAFLNLFTDNYDKEELYDLKDEVKEFKLHDIVVQNYNDLRISRFIEFLKEY